MKLNAPNAACSRCEKLDRQVAQLAEQLRAAQEQVAQQQKQIAVLQSQVEEKSRAAKRQAAPFRRSRKKPASQRKPPGRKAGHAPSRRSDPPEVDRVLDAKADVCPDCGVELQDKTIHVQYQTDIPPVVPVVTQFNVEVGTCPCCKKRVQGQHSEQTSQALGAANHTLGPRSLAFAADLKYRLGVPFRKIADLFGGLFQLDCCAGALCRATARLADLAKGAVDVLKLQLPGRFVVHMDETSWWMGGEKKWLHTAATDDIVLFQVGNRSNAIAVELLGSDFAGIVSCDGYAGYDLFQTARCNAHVLRRIRDLLETDAVDHSLLAEIQDLLQNGLELRDRREELTDLGFERLATILKNRVHTWIEANRQHEQDSIGRLARHLQRYETEFLRYLDDPRIPASNNYGESTLRFAVLLRKVGCCNRTERGVRTFEILASLLATYRQRGKDFIGWAIELLQGGGPKYVPPDLLPPNFQGQILLARK